LPPFNPSTFGFRANAEQAFEALFGEYTRLGGIAGREVAFVVGFGTLLGLAILRYRSKTAAWLYETFLAGGRYLLIGWAVTYTCLVILQRTIYHFDFLGPRLLVPGGITLVLCLVAFATRVLKVGSNLAFLIATIAAVVSIAQQIETLSRPPTYTFGPGTGLPALIAWFQENSTDEDLIISKDAVEIPYRLDRSGVVSYSPYPYNVHLRYDKVLELARHRCADYQHIFLAATVTNADEESNRRDYGEFITDLASLRYEQYLELTLVAQPPGAVIYEVAKCGRTP
jgi:hypothetical protein